MSLFKDISTDIVKLLCWIIFCIALFFVVSTAFYYWDFYINLEQNTRLIQKCIDDGNTEEVCKGRVY